MARKLTNQEKELARSWWPSINADNVRVSDEATKRYNCLAWVLGITSSWVWPWGSREPDKAESDAFMRQRGFKPVGSGEVAVLGGSDDMKHYSISGSGHGPGWESKCGGWLRIQHELGEMESGVYGRTRGFYTHGRLYVTGVEEAVEPGKLEVPVMPDVFTNEELAFVENRARTVNEELRKEFEKRYTGWRGTWDRPGIIISSCPADYARSQEFFDLVSLGADILPLLMNKLKDPDEFFVLQAVELLAPAVLMEDSAPDDPVVLEGEQGRAQHVLKRWIALED